MQNAVLTPDKVAELLKTATAPIEISRDDLLNFLIEHKGANIISFRSTTEPKVKKTAPFINLRKGSHVNGIIGFNYSNSVNNQRLREGNEEKFEAHPRAWGERIGTSPVIEHKGQYYLEIKVEKTLTNPEYFDDNGPVEAEAVKPHLYARSPSKRQETDKEIILRDYKLESLDQIRINGKDFILTN